MSIKNKKRKQSLILIGTLLILTVLIGFSYSMFTANVRKTNETGTAIKTKVMGLIYTGRSDIDETGILPGRSFTKAFTVENITDEATWYNIYMENITNDYGEDLVYTLYETDSNYENVIRTVVSEKKLPDTVNGKKYLKTRIDIEAQPKTQYYKMVITYKETEGAQEYDKDAEFEGTVGIDQNTEAEEDIPDIDPENDYTITINPNGGLYEESLDVQTVVRRGGETYNVSIPTRVGHTFNGWEVSDSYSYKNDVVTIYSNNVTLKAKWTLTDDTVAVAQIVRTGTKYARIQEAEIAAANDDTIKILKDTSEVFANEKTVTIDFDDNTVTGKLNNTGDITLINGTLQNEDDYAINNTGTLTLGIDEGTVDIDDIAIKTDVDHNAIKQDGSMKFYDGYVEGYVAIIGPANEVPSPVEEEGRLRNYVVYVEHNEEDGKAWQKAYPVKEPSAYVKRTDGSDFYYNDLQDAVKNSMDAGKTIYAIADFDATQTTIKADSKYDIVIDINGHTVRLGDTVTNNKNLTITNSQSTGQLLPSRTMTNNGNLLIKDIIINAQQDQNIINNTSSLTIENSTLTAKSAYAVSNTGSGTISLDNDTYLHATNYALYNNATSETVVEGGNIYGINNAKNLVIRNTKVYNNGSNYAINNTGTLTFSGEMESTGTGIYSTGTVYSNGIIETKSNSINTTNKVYITGGKVESENGRAVVFNSWDTGVVEITDGILRSKKSSAVHLNIRTTINVKGGKVESETTSAITMDNYGKVNVSAGEVIGKGNGIDAGDSSEVTVSGGYIEGKNTGINRYSTYGFLTITGGTIVGKTQYGIYNDFSTGGTTTIGIKDGILESEIENMTPVIQGGINGLYVKSGIVNFYDGILKGKTAGYAGAIAAIEDGSIIKEGTEEIDEETYQLDYLYPERNFLRITFAPDDIREYNSFNKALADIVANQAEATTIDVIAGGTTEEDQILIKSTVTIPSNKKAIIEMNGYTLYFTQPIQNNGELTIKDSSQDNTGTLTTSTTVNILQNSNKLNIEDVNIVKNNGTNYAISNSGTLNFSGKIESTGNGIYNSGTVYSNGIIETKSTSINTINKVYITGGKVESENGRAAVLTGDNVGLVEITDGILRSKKSSAVHLNIRTTINVKGGLVESETTSAITMNNYGRANVSAGEVKGKTNGIDAPYSSEVTVSGGYIEGNNIGINRTSTYGFLTITGGTIVGKTQYGIYNDFSTGGTTTIGIKDGILESEIENMTPVIQGGINGLYVKSGTVNFYDGILKGKTDGYTGAIAAIEDGSIVKDGTEEIDGETYQLDYLYPERNFLRITFAPDDIREYNSFNKALADIEANQAEPTTIDVIAGGVVEEDQIIVKSPITIASNKKVIIEMNGYTLYFTQPIQNNGELTIKDSSQNNTGTMATSAPANLLQNSNKLNIEDANLIKNNGSNYAISNSGTLNFSGKIESTGNGIYNSGTVNSDGIVESKSNAITSTNKIYVTGGKIESENGRAVIFSGWETGLVELTDGILKSKKSSAVHLDIRTKINVKGGKVESETTSAITMNNYGRVNVSAGEVIGKGNGIDAAYASEVTISGGYIEGNNIGINRTSTYGFLTITGGTIVGKTQYGVYNDLSSGGTTTIGTNDANAPLNEPVIQGNLYGLYIKSGTLNYYDGILKGVTDAYTGEFYSIVNNGNILYGTEVIDEETYITASLELQTDVVKNEKTGVIYNNIQDAINAIDAEETDVTLTLLKDVSIYSPITINKNITFDMHGYTIFAARKITNTGNIKFYSSTTQSKIYTVFAINMLTNSGTIDLSNIEFQNNKTSNYQFVNNGTAVIDNIKITGIYGMSCGSNAITTLSNSIISASETAINNSGKITINNGTYTGGSYGIYDNSTKENTIDTISTTNMYYNNNSDNSIENCQISSGITKNNGTILIEDSNITNGISNNGGRLDSNGNTIRGNIRNSSVFNISNDDIYSWMTNSGTMVMEDSNNTISEHGGGVVGISNSGNLTIRNSKLKITNTNNHEVTGINNTGNSTFICDACEIEMTNSNGYEEDRQCAISTSSSASIATLENVNINKTGGVSGYANYGLCAISGTINVKSGTINVSSTNNVRSIYNEAGIINIEDVDVTTSGTTASGIYSSGGTTTILDGNIVATGTTNGYGIYLNGGTVIMGEAEVGEYRGTENATVSTSIPYAKGIGTTAGNGVKNVNGSFKLYDGLLVGSTEAKPDALTDKEYHYDPAFGTDLDGYQTCYLVYNPVSN